MHLNHKIMPTSKLIKPKGLNELQKHLLEMFSFEVSKKELEKLKELLVNFYDDLAKNEMTKVWKTKKMSSKTIENIDKIHRRTAYK